MDQVQAASGFLPLSANRPGRTEMNSEPQMDTNEHKLLLKKEVFQVVDCAMEVLNTLGHGLLEKPYENALVVEIVVATKTIDRITDLERG